MIELGSLIKRVTRERYSWFVFLTLLICYAYFFPRWADWNENSRFDLVLAVADKGTLAIDDYYQNTGDYAVFNGHYYSDKAPGLAFLGIPTYLAFKATLARPLAALIPARLENNLAVASTLRAGGTGLLADKIQFIVALTFVSFFVVAVPSALLGVLLYNLLGHFSKNEFNKLGLNFAYGLATPAFAYANNFYSHQVVAFCLFAAFYLVFTLAPESRVRRALRLSAVGFLSALSLIAEYPAALIVTGVGLYALVRVRDWRQWIWLAVGGVLPMALMAAYDLAIFGTALPMGYKYSALYQDFHDVGIIGVTTPSLSALFGITLSPYRGLFFVAPFLLLAVPGIYYWWRGKTFRAELAVTLWSVLSFFLFVSATDNWWFGFDVGPRYLLPMLPFLILPIIFLLEAIQTRWLRVLTGVLIVLSCVLVWVEALGGQMFPQRQENPLFEYSLPHFLAGDIARNFGTVLGLSGYSSLFLLLLIIGLLFGGMALTARRVPNDPRRHALLVR